MPATIARELRSANPDAGDRRPVVQCLRVSMISVAGLLAFPRISLGQTERAAKRQSGRSAGGLHRAASR